MSVTSQKKIKTPFYYIKKRFLANKPALFSAWIISLSILMAIFGYLIMPDSTPNANDGAVQIQKKPPGFHTQILKTRKNIEVEEVNVFTKMLFGQESPYTIVPITAYRIDTSNLVVYVKVYGREDKEYAYSIINVVKPIFLGNTPKINPSALGNFTLQGNMITYVDLNEQLKTISRKDLLSEFYQNHIEERKFWIGTDKLGRDMLSRLIFGIRISLGIGLLSVLISLIVGGTLGALSGFFGGWIDKLIMWLMTVVWSIPSVMLVIAISLALQSRGIWVVFVSVGLTTWVEIARVVRGQIMAIKQKLFIEAARALGVKDFYIIVRHILPNILGPLIVITSANFASAILMEAGLSFLGLGVQPPMPSWGMMVYEGFTSIGSYGGFYLVFFPSFCISIMVLVFNLIGNGLRDAYDPNTLLK